MNYIDVISLSSGITSLILAFFAIWLSLHHKKESDLVNGETKKLLQEVHTDAKIVSKVAMPELQAYGESMRKYIFEIVRPQNNKESYEVINKIENEIKNLKESNGLTKRIELKIEEIENNIKKNKLSLSNSGIEVSKDYLLLDLEDTEQGVISFPFDQFETVQDFLDLLWVNFINQSVASYTYGLDWELINTVTNGTMKSKGRNDIRPLTEAGLIGGIKYKVKLF